MFLNFADSSKVINTEFEREEDRKSNNSLEVDGSAVPSPASDCVSRADDYAL